MWLSRKSEESIFTGAKLEGLAFERFTMQMQSAFSFRERTNEDSFEKKHTILISA